MSGHVEGDAPAHLDAGLRYEFVGPTYTTANTTRITLCPSATTIRRTRWRSISQPNIPGQAPTQGPSLPVPETPTTAWSRRARQGLPKGGLNFRWNNFGPRLGFAYDVFGDGKTALRGGFGIFFERYQQNVFNFGGVSNPPTVYTPTIYGGNIANISPSLANGAPLTPAAASFLRSRRVRFLPPTATTSVCSVSCLTSWSSTSGYVGNTSRHQMYMLTTGAAAAWVSPPARQFSPRSTTCPRPSCRTKAIAPSTSQVRSQQRVQRAAGQGSSQIQQQAHLQCGLHLVQGDRPLDDVDNEAERHFRTTRNFTSFTLLQASIAGTSSTFNMSTTSPIQGL
jgi:hypothetical protein